MIVDPFNPMTQQPMTQQPMTQQPMTQQPMTQQPMTQQPEISNTLQPGYHNPVPQNHLEKEKVERESRPAQGEWFTAKLLSINLGTDSRNREKVYGLIEIDNEGVPTTYSFNSYRSYIIIQALWLNFEITKPNGALCNIQGEFKPKYNKPDEYMLMAEDLEIDERKDLREKAYQKVYPDNFENSNNISNSGLPKNLNNNNQPNLTEKSKKLEKAKPFNEIHTMEGYVPLPPDPFVVV